MLAEVKEGKEVRAEVYRDNLVEIAERRITFFHYGILGRAKTIPFKEISEVVPLEPSVWNGKYRYHGTGDFRTWFPRDFHRPSRDAIFLLRLNNSWKRIGFTAENTSTVFELLQRQGLIAKGACLTKPRTPKGKRSSTALGRAVLTVLGILAAVGIPIGVILYAIMK